MYELFNWFDFKTAAILEEKGYLCWTDDNCPYFQKQFNTIKEASAFLDEVSPAPFATMEEDLWDALNGKFGERIAYFGD